ncbi:hypothetical protein CkaCkLH20_11030 [Colletotrichum karsti]|uniref:Ecp2 effector protein domain-containing protein n=1 Tax=Colletotrichum karsti TaxID=1095194 RepID=A0A9P6HV67_9PEZI|nr:uncharacterized protein CkaCkLH20_11030 [Colletotrichum karsti]KAF9871383.1 hypothetical protein CkaCkLH20_11030 [Colletotrichum karsti]
MVNFALPALATLALASIAGAAPTAAAAEVFTFSAWVEGIIANPDGDNLTPEEAVEAWRASKNITDVAAGTSLEKRASCNTMPGREAWIPDAVYCINYLAGKGSTRCEVRYDVDFCTAARAKIFGRGPGTATVASSCNDVARGAGYIMDSCSRADNTVMGSEYAHGNGDLLVWIVN